jgi:hypothetical protein
MVQMSVMERIVFVIRPTALMVHGYDIARSQGQERSGMRESQSWTSRR